MGANVNKKELRFEPSNRGVHGAILVWGFCKREDKLVNSRCEGKRHNSPGRCSDNGGRGERGEGGGHPV